MREGVLFGLVSENIGRVASWLAVIGGGVLGALLTGVVASLLAKALFLGRLPRLARGILCLLGGVAAGWLAFLLIFGGGGPGLGGGGGWNAGNSGTNTGGQNEPQKLKNENGPSDKAADKGTLRVEVLGDAALAKIAKSDTYDKDQRYRIETGKGSELLKLRRGEGDKDDGLEERIEKRMKQEPPLRVLEVIVYKDSPSASKNSYVTDLLDWAREVRTEGQERLKVDIVKRDRKAPVP